MKEKHFQLLILSPPMADMGIKMNWERFFSSRILGRGYDYYLSGNIESITKLSNSYKAIVSGMDEYVVNISLNSDNDIDYMNCTCPYADDGSYCKHMAAVLYAIDDNDEGENSTETNNDFSGTIISDIDKVRDIILEMEPELIRKELVTIMENDQTLRADFLLKHIKDQENIIHYIKKLKKSAYAIFRGCSDRHGFIDWRNAFNLISRLDNEIMFNLRDFTADEKEAKAAFDVSLYVYDLFNNTDIDDSGGETQMFVSGCIELWNDIIENNESENFAKYIFEKLNSISDKVGLGEYMSDEIENFISEHFNEDSFLSARLSIIDKRIKHLTEDESQVSDYTLSNCIMERINIMKEMGLSFNEIIAFRDRYRFLSAVREDEMRELEASDKIQELIRLLNESKDIDSKYPGLVCKYSKKLIELYKNENEPEKAKEELFKYFNIYSRGNINAFSEYKQFFKESEWIKEREKILKNLLNHSVDIKPLLAAEGLKAQLFDLLVIYVNQMSGFEKFKIMEISKYENALRPDYDNELLDLYERLISNTAKISGGRPHYQEIVRFIRLMFGYPGGKERADELLRQWRILYANRPAMQDELRALNRDL